MRVLVVGASGFIGSAVCARLLSEGYVVTGVSRSATPAALGAVRHLRVDMAMATQPGDWLPLLEGIEAVVNCAGVLQDAPGDSTRTVHADAAAALFRACERARVRRVVHISAAGVDRPLTSFSEARGRYCARRFESRLVHSAPLGRDRPPGLRGQRAHSRPCRLANPAGTRRHGAATTRPPRRRNRNGRGLPASANPAPPHPRTGRRKALDVYGYGRTFPPLVGMAARPPCPGAHRARLPSFIVRAMRSAGLAGVRRCARPRRRR